MTLREIAEKLGLEPCAGSRFLDRPVTGGYASDLMSDVVANSKAGDVWVTLQTHENIIAVAALKELAGIIIVGNRTPDEETRQRADAEMIPLLSTGRRTFEVVAGLIRAGVPERGA